MMMTKPTCSARPGGVLFSASTSPPRDVQHPSLKTVSDDRAPGRSRAKAQTHLRYAIVQEG